MVPQCKSAASPPGSAAVPVQRFSSSEERTCGSWVQTSSSSIEHKKAFLNPSHPSTTPKPQFALPKRSDAESAASMPKELWSPLDQHVSAGSPRAGPSRRPVETGREDRSNRATRTRGYAWLGRCIVPIHLQDHRPTPAGHQMGGVWGCRSPPTFPTPVGSLA